jgi:hypothetical protein
MTTPEVQAPFWSESNLSRRTGPALEGSTEPLVLGLKNWDSVTLAPPIRNNTDGPSEKWILFVVDYILSFP